MVSPGAGGGLPMYKTWSRPLYILYKTWSMYCMQSFKKRCEPWADLTLNSFISGAPAESTLKNFWTFSDTWESWTDCLLLYQPSSKAIRETTTLCLWSLDHSLDGYWNQPGRCLRNFDATDLTLMENYRLLLLSPPVTDSFNRPQARKYNRNSFPAQS